MERSVEVFTLHGLAQGWPTCGMQATSGTRSLRVVYRRSGKGQRAQLQAWQGAEIRADRGRGMALREGLELNLWHACQKRLPLTGLAHQSG